MAMQNLYSKPSILQAAVYTAILLYVYSPLYLPNYFNRNTYIYILTIVTLFYTFWNMIRQIKLNKWQKQRNSFICVPFYTQDLWLSYSFQYARHSHWPDWQVWYLVGVCRVYRIPRRWFNLCKFSIRTAYEQSGFGLIKYDIINEIFRW